MNKLKTSTPVAAIKPPDLTKIDVPTAAELLDKAAPVIGASKDAVNAVVSTTKDAAGEAKNTLAATGTAVADTLKAGGPWYD